MPSLMQSTKNLEAERLFLCLGLWLWLFARQARHLRSLAQRLALLATAALCSLWLLSACGTARSPVLIRPPVPAALLVAPKAPTLLIPNPVPQALGSRSMTPGTTTPPTPEAAPKTGSGIGR